MNEKMEENMEESNEFDKNEVTSFLKSSCQGNKVIQSSSSCDSTEHNKENGILPRPVVVESTHQQGENIQNANSA